MNIDEIFRENFNGFNLFILLDEARTLLERSTNAIDGNKFRIYNETQHTIPIPIPIPIPIRRQVNRLSTCRHL